ncbi:MAG TPA: hypothetical protein VHW66_22250 [Stellaceae bacterium]|jgi:DNA-directed RNA polymerase specialized sigma24 family protein|nr:hypothetical protein [Stellaceae bacterium]
MNASLWARYARLQSRLDVCRDPDLAAALEGALNGELAAVANGKPYLGTEATAVDNQRLKERRRRSLDATFAAITAGTYDPWPQVDARIELTRRLAPLSLVAAGLILQKGDGASYEELADAYGRPVGTIKSQIFRAKFKFAA